MDAVLDLLDVQTCSANMQVEFESTMAAIADGTAAGVDQVRYAARKARPFAEMLSIVHPVAGMAANYGLGRLSGEGNAVADAMQDTDSREVGQLARVVMACRFALGECEQKESIRMVRDGILADLRSLDSDPSAGPSDPQRSRLLTSALGMVSELIDGDNLGVDDMPNLVGRNLAEAKRMLTALGLAFTITDDLAPNGVGRMIMADANWRIVTAEQSDGRVRLLVRKNTDPAKAPPGNI
jgi:hypothetical protein